MSAIRGIPASLAKTVQRHQGSGEATRCNCLDFDECMERIARAAFKAGKKASANGAGKVP